MEFNSCFDSWRFGGGKELLLVSWVVFVIGFCYFTFSVSASSGLLMFVAFSLVCSDALWCCRLVSVKTWAFGLQVGGLDLGMASLLSGT